MFYSQPSLNQFMIIFTIFLLNWNRTRYDNVDDLKIKNGLGIERDVMGRGVQGGEVDGGESCWEWQKNLEWTEKKMMVEELNLKVGKKLENLWWS